MNIFEGWQEFKVEGASVPFYKYSEGGVKFIGFDSRACIPPEPMMNALLAIKFADADTKIVMVNHKFPAGLIPKIEGKFNIEREDLDGEQVKMTFSLKPGESAEGIDASLCH